MPDMIHDTANRIKTILHPVETSSINPKIYKAIMLIIKQTPVVMAFVLVLLPMNQPLFFNNSGT